MKPALLLAALILVGAGAAAWAPAAPADDVVLKAPRTAVIGGAGTSGETRLSVRFSGFADTPHLDVHTRASAVEFDDLRIDASGTGDGTFSFTLSYNALSPGKFRIQVLAHDGTGDVGSDHQTSCEIDVVRP
ncbi:MAG: hypothetical protein ACYTAF_09180 [Planctomycetota bacterium]|jgi:hypothetical protein